MKDFRSDKKIGTVMNRIAKGYTDAEIDNVAQFYSELK
jgi:sulfide dehydrogenase cytochrome subunit